MDKNIAIEFDGVGKQYRLGLVGTGSLQHDINRWWQTAILRKEDPYLKIGEVNDRSKKGTSDYVWALKDISFKVEQGDVVGIIGKNGAGKSTLLKLLSHITAPSVGHIRYRGRIASLLEVGTGFHPEMTARQNIYMNGSIMGMTRHEITSKLDEIVDFAGIERYLDTPVKRFSSGMTVRLGFAVAAFLEPEILVVDEVLAVGDAEFQKKAIGKMKDVSSHGGRTVLFVSHNMPAVRNLCKHGVVLKNGMVDHVGSADDCVDYYMSSAVEDFSRHVIVNNSMRPVLLDRELEIMEVYIENDNRHIASDEPLIFNLKIKINSRTVGKFTLGYHVKNAQDQTVGTYVSSVYDIPQDKEIFDVKLQINDHNLSRGKYTTFFNVGLKVIEYGNRDYDILYNVINFEVTDLTKGKPLTFWINSWGNILYHNVSMIII